MRAFVVLVLSIGPFSWPHAAVSPPPSMTSFERGHDGIVLAVRLNGRGPFRLLLDTGSTHTGVSAATAAAIGAPVVAKTVTGSVAGSRSTLVVRIDALEVGPVTHGDLLASVVDVDGIALGGMDGILGQDGLAALRYTIDFSQRRIVWWPDEPLMARGRPLDLESSHGRYVLALPQRQSVLRLVPDTGAASLLLFGPAPPLPVTPLPGLATLTTPSGAISVQLATMRELRVGSLTLRDVPAAVAPRDRSEPAAIDGLLPLHLFDRVTVDGPGKRMIAEKS